MKRTATSTGFADKDRLVDIRVKSLNPLLSRVDGQIGPDLEQAKKDILLSYKHARIDEAKKALVLVKQDGTEESIPLDTIIPPEFKGITISDGTTASSEITNVTFDDSIITKSGAEATVAFNWASLIPTHQELVSVELGTVVTPSINKIVLTGNEGNASVSGKTLTLEVPKDPIDIKAKIDTTGSEEKVITKILIEGNTTGTSINDDGELTLKIPTPLAGTGGNFQGFFDNEGDMVSEVTSPEEGKSFAFVKDDKLKGQYYTAWMYVNGGWTEAPIDPAITYEPIDGTEVKGVFSIKPNTKIKIDVRGQLDLDGLADGHFIGFFASKNDLRTACPNPIIDRSAAYIINPATRVCEFWRYANDPTTGEDPDWTRTLAAGTISAVTKGSGGVIATAKPVYALEESPMVTVDNGIATVKDITTQRVRVIAQESTEGLSVDKMVKGFKFIDGIYVDLTKEPDWAIIHHPQRVIHYDSKWEATHASSIYLGHMFYDDSSGTWMGYSPDVSTTDKQHWTRMIHRHMSDEVKDLSERLPVEARTVVPSNTAGDNGQWDHSGWTYIESAFDAGLTPEAKYKNKGLYVQTYVRAPLPTAQGEIAKFRMQVGFIEDEEGGDAEIFTRVQDTKAGDTDPFWKNWVKVSLGGKDLEAHNNDPAAHSNHMIYHKAVSFGVSAKVLRSQVAGASGGGILTENCNLLVDNYGLLDYTNDSLLTPYKGKFRITGNLAFSGFTDRSTNFPRIDLRVLVRKRAKDGTTWDILGQFIYRHVDPAFRYPMLSFECVSEFDQDDSIVINITALDSEWEGVLSVHPHLYFQPVKSFIAFEDERTRSGSNIANSFSKLLGNMDMMGNVGARVHYTDYEPSRKTIRQYAVPVSNTALPMTKS